MTIYEKIRFLRQQKLWSQEQMANYLGMSINGYGSIERGDTDICLSRLEQIAALFGIDLHQLFALNEEKNGFYFFGANNTGQNTGIQNNNVYCHHHYSEGSIISECDYLRQKFELEKQQLINEMQEKELYYVREINALKEKKLSYLKEINRLIRNQNVEIS